MMKLYTWYDGPREMASVSVVKETRRTYVTDLYPGNTVNKADVDLHEFMGGWYTSKQKLLEAMIVRAYSFVESAKHHLNEKQSELDSLLKHQSTLDETDD